MKLNFWPFKRKPKPQPRWIMIPSVFCNIVRPPNVLLPPTILVPQVITDWVEECCPEAYFTQYDGCKALHFPDDQSMLQFQLTFNFDEWRNENGEIIHP